MRVLYRRSASLVVSGGNGRPCYELQAFAGFFLGDRNHRRGRWRSHFGIAVSVSSRRAAVLFLEELDIMRRVGEVTIQAYFGNGFIG